MKIEVNVEKRHLYFFVGFLVLLGAGYVMADYTEGVFHDFLYVDKMKSYTNNEPVTVEDSFIVNDNVLINGNLEVGGEICDSTECWTLSQLAGGGGNGGGGSTIIEQTFSGSDLKIDGKYIDYSNSDNFCKYKNYDDAISFERKDCFIGIGDVKSCSSNCNLLDSWTDIVCKTSSGEGYLDSVKCSIEGSPVSYWLGTEDDPVMKVGGVDYNIGYSIQWVGSTPQDLETQFDEGLQNTANQFCGGLASEKQYLKQGDAYSYQTIYDPNVCNVVGGLIAVFETDGSSWNVVSCPRGGGGLFGHGESRVLTHFNCIE
ncbi:MAG: hypothetical protein KJ674_03170 [Nanoarchaeota archaeon]|nr:hypothetical protein [Nanoarchaeota archaeon]